MCVYRERRGYQPSPLTTTSTAGDDFTDEFWYLPSLPVFVLGTRESAWGRSKRLDYRRHQNRGEKEDEATLPRVPTA